MVLDIIEVSQKQAYIFASNRLRDNVNRSAQIAYVTSPDFFKSVCVGEYDDKNLVYAGGGHTVLQFEDEESARVFNKKITKAILEKYPEMETFVKISSYDESQSPHKNLKKLISDLEIKKSLRISAFRKGSYGIEAIDSDTRQPKRLKESTAESLQSLSEKEFIPEGFTPVFEISDLGDSFAAIVHIDGNGMGKRVSDFQNDKGGSGKKWTDFAGELRHFSESVDNDFKDAYREMNKRVGDMLKSGKLDMLKLKQNDFPVRRIITSGDDICFVCAGCIGIECARIFIEELCKKTNDADGKKYNACAGVAIVHAKYPFFRAYELAEALCSNAKSLGASLSKEDNGAGVSSIDWHIEYGEMGDNLSDIRDMYLNEEGRCLNMRPFIISASEEINKKESARQYENFKKTEAVVSNNNNGYARGSVKELRSILRKKEDDAWYYLKYHKIEGLAMESYQGIYKDIDYEKTPTGDGLEKQLFIKTYDGKLRSTLFDAIEIMDEFVSLD